MKDLLNLLLALALTLAIVLLGAAFGRLVALLRRSRETDAALAPRTREASETKHGTMASQSEAGMGAYRHQADGTTPPTRLASRLGTLLK